MPEKPGKLRPALFGGIITGLTIGVPFLGILNCCCCAGVLLGGLLSVFFYKNDLTVAMPPLTNSDALQLGALSGLFGALTGTAISALVLALFGNITGEGLYNFIYGIYERAGILDQLPPGTLEQFEQTMMGHDQLAFFSVLSTLFTWLIIGPLFGLLGGLIGYSIFKQKTPPVNMQPPMPPMNPPLPPMNPPQ